MVKQTHNLQHGMGFVALVAPKKAVLMSFKPTDTTPKLEILEQ
jgi:hypothetical protein